MWKVERSFPQESSSACRARVTAGVGTRACVRPQAKRKAKKWTGAMVPGGATPLRRRGRGCHKDDRAMHARTTEPCARGRRNRVREDNGTTRVRTTEPCVRGRQNRAHKDDRTVHARTTELRVQGRQNRAHKDDRTARARTTEPCV